MQTCKFATMALMLAACAAGAAAAPISVQLREARYAEEMKGDLDGAIKIYEKVIFNAEADRTHVAEAYYRLGLCYAKKGQTEQARSRFQTVLSQYADQADVADRAKQELARLEDRVDGVVADAVKTISTCAEGDPKVKKAMDSLQGRDEAAVIKELLVHLDSKTDTIRRAAIYVLWKAGFSDIAPAKTKLTDLCGHPEEFTRGMAAIALGQHKVTDSLDALCKMTAEDASPYARRCAAYALGLLGNPKAVETLQKAQADADESVRANATAALGMLTADTPPVASAVAKPASIVTDEPVVISSVPATYATDVSADLKRLAVTFNQPMFEGNYSWVQWDAPFPQLTGGPSFDALKTTCSVPAKLEPGKCYLVGINIPPFNSFQSKDGITARPFALVFATKDEAGNPTPIPPDLYAKAKQVNDELDKYVREYAKDASADMTGMKELAVDDGKSVGKSSIGGSGHAVLLEAPADNMFLRAVRIYGSRYGEAQAPKENFQVWLCDEQAKVLHQFDIPYSKFVRGKEKWVTLPVDATPVPRRFILCAGFNPTKTKGVYVHYDATGSGKSSTGLPTTKLEAFAGGDWMIRAVVGGAKPDAAKPTMKDKLESERLNAQAWAIWNQGKYAESEPIFRQALDKDPANIEALNGLGWALTNQAKPLAGKEAFEKCLALNPKHPGALNGMGWIAKNDGKVDEAIAYWQKAVEAAPYATAAIAGLCTTYVEQKDYENAMRYYNIWLKADPTSADAKAGLEKARKLQQEEGTTR